MAKPRSRSASPPAPPQRSGSVAGRFVFTVTITMLLALVGVVTVGWFAISDLIDTMAADAERFGWQALDRLAQPAVLAGLVGLAALVPLSAWLAAGGLLGPLRQVTNGVRALGQGERRVQIPARGRGEVVDLAAAVNGLAAALRAEAQQHEAQVQELGAVVRRLDGLRRVNEAMVATLEVEHLVRAAVALIRQEFGYDRVGVGVMERGGLVFTFSSAAEDPLVAPPSQPVPLSDRLVVGRAALTFQPQREDDLSTAQRTGLLPGFPLARSELAVPVAYQGRVLAVLVVQSGSPGVFGDEDQRMLVALASVLGYGIGNGARFRAEQVRRQLAEAIYRISQSLSSSANLESVPGLLLDQLAQVLLYDRSAVLLISDRRLVLETERGEPGGWNWQQQSGGVLPDPLTAAALREGRPQRSDANDDRSAIAAPLLRHGHPIGVVVVERDQPGGYGDEEQRAMLALVGQAAVAMENIALYAEAQDRTNRLKVVSELFDDVSSSRNLSGVLQTIVQRIRMFVPCDYASIAHYEAPNNSFLLETLYDASSEELPGSVRYAAADTPWKSVFDTSVPSYSRDLRRSIFPFEVQLASHGLWSCVVVPIASEGGSLGTLNLASRTPGAFSQEQIGTLSELSRYIASAILNANQRMERERTVSELARAQERLTLTARLHAVGELAGGIAHDFNNLLAGIMGNAQLLLFETQSDDQREMLQVIERAARSGAETVRRLQTFTRVDHDQVQGEVVLHLIARDAIDLTRPRWRDLAQKQGRSIEVRRELLPVPSIIGQPSALRDVVTNLIINAVDAMPQGGTLTVRTFPQPSLESGEPIQEVVVEVSDTGVGMTPEILQRIFDRYFTTKGKAGTGQGLSEVQEKVSEHGGSVSVVSAPGKGSTFTVRLPLRQGYAAPSARLVDADGPMTPAGILVVEDDELVRDSLVRLLQRWGHRVTATGLASDALERIVPGRFDVLITDLGLPDMPGWVASRRAREADPAIRIILLTGWADDGDLADHDAQMDVLLPKPFGHNELRAALLRVLG